MSQRSIHKFNRAHPELVADALESLLVMEILTPPKLLYLCSPWITDLSILRNGYGQYRVLLPELVNPQVRLSAVLNALAERGCTVRIICRPTDPLNQHFLSRLVDGIGVGGNEDIHSKYIVCDHFTFVGSMNFTYSGVHSEQQNTTQISTDLADISRLLLDSEELWNRLVTHG